MAERDFERDEAAIRLWESYVAMDRIDTMARLNIQPKIVDLMPVPKREPKQKDEVQK